MGPEPDLPSIYRFLAYRETDASQETFFKNVLALPPAHTLLYAPSKNSPKIERYWDLDRSAEIRYAESRNYPEHLLELLRGSVKIRLRSDVPVGACLSGGLDSSSQLRWISLAKYAAAQMKGNGMKSIAGMVPHQLLARSKWLSGSFLEPVSLTPEFSKIAAGPPTQAPRKFKSSLHNELYQQLTCSMLPKLLRFADRSSMAFSREVRLPYLDHRVVEFLFAIPESQKIQGAATKFILREAMRGRLPDKVLRRTDKKGFDTPQSAWLLGAMRPWVEDILHSNSFRQRGWIDTRRLCERALRSRLGPGDARPAHPRIAATVL